MVASAPDAIARTHIHTGKPYLRSAEQATPVIL